MSLFATVCLCPAATLKVRPSKSQFFQYESLSVSCGQQGDASWWRVKRNTSNHVEQECEISGAAGNKSHCFWDTLYPADAGVYWCESAAGQRSDTINITVHTCGLKPFTR